MARLGQAEAETHLRLSLASVIVGDLEWQAHEFPPMGHSQAVELAHVIAFDCGGGWRLPTRAEWRSVFGVLKTNFPENWYWTADPNGPNCVHGYRPAAGTWESFGDLGAGLRVKLVREIRP